MYTLIDIPTYYIRTYFFNYVQYYREYLLYIFRCSGAAQGRREAMDEDGEDHQGRAQTRPTTNTLMPPWMVRHLN